MNLHWTNGARSDLLRLHNFLNSVNPRAAIRAIESLATAARGLSERPRIGERVERYEPREVRRLLVGSYEMHYEILREAIYILRIWHTREDR